MITRFRLPVPRPPKFSVTPEPLTGAEPSPLPTIEVEVAEREPGATTLRARVPIENRIMIETPWTVLTDDIALHADRLRDFLVHQAWEQYDTWCEAWEEDDYYL